MQVVDKNIFFSIFSLSSSVIVGGILGYTFQIFSGRALGIEYWHIYCFIIIIAIISAALKFFI